MVFHGVRLAKQNTPERAQALLGVFCFVLLMLSCRVYDSWNLIHLFRLIQ